MKMKIISTTTFSFPDYPTFPKVKPPISSFKQGPDGVFGIALSTVFECEDFGSCTLPCIFWEVDLHLGSATERSTTFAYRNFSDLQIEYDAFNKVWVVALSEDPRYRHAVLDFYEIAYETHGQWLRLLSLEGMNGGGYYLVMLWQREASFSLVFAKLLGDGGLSPKSLFWRQWRNEDLVTSDAVRFLGKCFVEDLYRFDKTFLLFTCEYHRRSSLWRLCISAYNSRGIRLRSRLVPHVSFPNRYTEYWIADDLWNWLWPTISLTQGPAFGDEGRPTCVAVLLLKEQLERSRQWNEGRLADINHGLPSVQGGLYWVDDHGHILHHESSVLGEQISLCLCQTTIVGTDRLDNQQRLWSWSPIDKTELVIRAAFASDVEHVTLVAMGSANQEAASLFWCVEEYAQGIRVSLWETGTFQEVQSNWVTGMWLAARRPELGSCQEHSVVAYQNTLLVLVITQERRFQVIQFYRDDS